MTITPDRMEILSLPGPDRSITDEHLENRVLVSRRYRNRRIGDFLKELEIVEGRNTGVPLILRAMANNGSGLPTFETDDERSYFLTILPVHPCFLDTGKAPKGKRRNDPVNPYGRRSRSEIRAMVIDLLAKKGDMSSSEIAGALGYKRVNNALRAGEVSYLYPERPNSRNPKICLQSR